MINSNDKVSIRTMAKFIAEKQYNKQVLRRINTGSNVYTVICEYKPKTLCGEILEYSVNKRAKSGKDMGTTDIIYITPYEVTTDNRIKLPDSVLRYLKNYYTTISRYMDVGERAFNELRG